MTVPAELPLDISVEVGVGLNQERPEPSSSLGLKKEAGELPRRLEGNPLFKPSYWRICAVAPGGVDSMSACVGGAAVVLKKMVPLWFVANDRLPVEVKLIGSVVA